MPAPAAAPNNRGQIVAIQERCSHLRSSRADAISCPSQASIRNPETPFDRAEAFLNRTDPRFETASLRGRFAIRGLYHIAASGS
jgi:hypothetical protein